jgi:hypothetical protein
MQKTICGVIKKDGTLCEHLTTKERCKYHALSRTPKTCTFIYKHTGKVCARPCRGLVCSEHSKNSVEKRRELSKINMRKKRNPKIEEEFREMCLKTLDLIRLNGISLPDDYEFDQSFCDTAFIPSPTAVVKISSV